jgi:hypothetical protein
MGTIEKIGFLSGDIGTWIEKHRQENKEYFDLSEGLNELSQSLMLQLEPKKDKEQEVIVSLLYCRVISHFQGVIILAERGMTSEARSIIRGLLDAVFACCALAKNQELVKDFINDDLCQRLKIVNSFMSLPKDVKRRHKTSNSKLKALAKEIQQEIDEKSVKPLTSEFLAQKAGMQGHYHTMFSLLSSSTHSRARDLERYFQDADGNKIPDEIIWGPDVSDVDNTLYQACECIFISTRVVLDLFKIENYEIQIGSLWEKYNKIGGVNA